MESICWESAVCSPICSADDSCFSASTMTTAAAAVTLEVDDGGGHVKRSQRSTKRIILMICLI